MSPSVLAVAFGSAAILIVFAVAIRSSSESGPDPLRTARDQAVALAAQPARDVRDPADTDVSARLERTAQTSVIKDVEASVPLPPGGSFDAIDWKAMGSTSVDGTRSFVEYNASCDWFRYFVRQQAAGADVSGIVKVLNTIPQWPSMRDVESRAEMGTIVAAAARGDAEPAKAQIRVNCGP